MSLPCFRIEGPCERHHRRILAGLLLGLLAASQAGWAQSNVQGMANAQGVAVLNDGRVFQGTVQEVPGGYRVMYPGGSSILPFDQISVTAVSLVGAYEAFRDSIQAPNADSHLKLAEWCLANGLYAQADLEVQSALRLEPMRSDALALLKQIDMILRRGSASGTSSPGQFPSAAPSMTVPPAAAPRAAISADSFTNPSERRPSGLSRQTQLDYMRKVQPLLMNKCGNAGCHGPNADNDLKLWNARPDSHGLRMASEHNQDVLFQFIDHERPDHSPLLRKPRESTPAHKNLFAADWQKPQFTLLEQWVRQAARERGPAVAGTKLPSRSTGEGPQRLTLIQSDSSAVQQVSGVSGEAGTPGIPAQLPIAVSARPLQTTPSDSPPAETGNAFGSDPTFLDRIRKAQRADAFDPEVFNRQMHAPSVSR